LEFFSELLSFTESSIVEDNNYLRVSQLEDNY